MKKAQRIIIKVGSSSLVLPSGKINELFFDKLIKKSTIINSLLDFRYLDLPVEYFYYLL